MFDKPKDQLQKLQQELLEVDPLDESEAFYTDEKHFYSSRSDAEKTIRRRLEKEEKHHREPKSSNKPKKKKKRSFLTFFVIVIEIVLIVVLLRWWSQWLT